MSRKIPLPSDEVLVFLVLSKEACFYYLFYLPFFLSSDNVWGWL
jgi:hypothetical protein